MVETHNFYQQKHVGPTYINRKKLSDQLGNGQGFLGQWVTKLFWLKKYRAKRRIG